jgi:hypothetical protein
MEGRLIDHYFDDADLKESLACIKDLPKPPPGY